MLISSTLKNWYLQNKRNLPWRNSRNPYYIWVSEIILQQTRIAQGINYYERFIKRFPDIETLANASTEDVLKLWQGLGYYSRARNLHEGARYVLQVFSGAVPENYDELLQIKGIGEYTAAAIGSIAFGLPYPAVDGNVNRVLARIYGIREPVNVSAGANQIKKIASSLMDVQNPGLSNQAIMEFGALQCIPRNPKCEKCPVKETCYAHLHDEVTLFPVKVAKQKIRNRYFNYLVVLDEPHKSICMKKRLEKDIWQGLYEFPLIETTYPSDYKELLTNDEWKCFFLNHEYTLIDISQKNSHQLSHQRIHATFYTITTKHISRLVDPAELINCDKITRYPVSRLIEDFLIHSPHLDKFMKARY